MWGALEDLLETRYASGSLAGCPILELAARVWEPDRYAAFRVCYGAMRRADDLVDSARARGWPIAAEEKRSIADAVHQALNGANADSELRRVRVEWAIPTRAWQLWTNAMISDLERDGFKSFREYRAYAQGAAVAPGAIFLHLCSLRRTRSGFAAPEFDVVRTAAPLAMFCYIVHVLRDFREDQLHGLQYFGDDLLARCALDRRALRAIARGAPAPPMFHMLVGEYQRCAGHYLQRARRKLRDVEDRIEPRYALSLDIVTALYGKLFEKSNLDQSLIARGALRLSDDDILKTIAIATERSRGNARQVRASQRP